MGTARHHGSDSDFVKQLLRSHDLTALGMQCCQGPKHGHIGSPLRSLVVDSQGRLVASNRLKDAGAFGVHKGGIGPKPLRGIEVGQRIRKAVELAARPRSGNNCHAVCGCISLLGPLSPILVARTELPRSATSSMSSA